MGLLYAVADGMGGHARGEIASALAIKELFARYYGTTLATEPRQALSQAMVETNGAVHQYGKEAGGGTMGTTLTTVLLRDNILYVGNIGDSRTYLVRGDKIKQLSLDHSLIGEQVRSGLLTEAQARTSSIRNVITRAVGYRDVVEPDTFAFTVNAGDILLLCSDGLHGLVENEEMARHFSTKSLKAAVDDLIELARERGGPDNITALAIRIDQIGEVVLSEDDERTTDVAIIVPDDQTTKPMPAIRPQHTDEIVADLPTMPMAAVKTAGAAAPGAPPPPPMAAPPIDHKAPTQMLQRVPAGAPVGSPPGPPPAFGSAPPPRPPAAVPAAAPARRGGIPTWVFLVVPWSCSASSRWG
jgi:protein phosphatase